MFIDKAYQLPELSEENLRKLSQASRAVFAWRTAMRVLPLLGGKREGIQVWPEKDINRNLSTILASLDWLILPFYGDSSKILSDLIIGDPKVSGEIESALASVVRSSIVQKNNYSTTSIARLTIKVISAAVCHTEQSIRVVTSISSLNEHFKQSAVEVAMKWDLYQLLQWESSNKNNDSVLSDDISFSPLWQIAENEAMPNEWPKIIELWHQMLVEYGYVGFSKSYKELLKGGMWELVASINRFNAWYEGYQKEKKSEPQGSLTASRATISGSGSVKKKSDVANTEKMVEAGFQGSGTAITQSDKPSNVDKLGRVSLVNTLANMLASPEQDLPMTIALLGDWGAGKSSVIAQLKSRLTKLEEPRLFKGGSDDVCKYLHAEFNAWEYEQTDNIRAGLAQEVVNGLLKDVNWLRKLFFAFHNAWQQHRWAFGWSLFGMSMVVLSSLGLLLGGDGLFTKDNAVTGSFVGVGAAAMISFVLFHVWKTARNILEHPLANQLQTYLKLPSYGEHLGLVPVIKEQISSMCKYRLGQVHNSRLLVVVDDLDRCSPECITETLDAVRLVMNLDNVVVLIAIDDRVAFRAVADHYERLSDNSRPSAAIARDYLGKIIQLPINLPVPGRDDMGRFINDELFKSAMQIIKTTVDDGVEIVDELTGTDLENKKGLFDRVEIEKHDDGSTTLTEWKSLSTKVATKNTDGGNEFIENMYALMRDTAEERDEFRALALEFEFINPRQLIRLKNSYRVLKGMRHDSDQLNSIAECHELLLGLFWSEYLFQMPVEINGQIEQGRRHAELLMMSALDSQSEVIDEIHASVGKRFARLFENVDDKLNSYFELMKTVSLVVLSSAQGGLLLSEKAVTDYKNNPD